MNNSKESTTCLLLEITSSKTKNLIINVICANETGKYKMVLKTFQGADAARLLDELITK